MAKPKPDEYRHKVITDPVHGDIGLSRIEVDLIDTQSFQRLRRPKQYPLMKVPRRELRQRLKKQREAA